jgi:L-ribulose-5-phosphate 4-epimerase
MEEDLKKRVCEANIHLKEYGLVLFSWGNVSALNEAGYLVAIKPSGVDYAELKPEDIVLIDLEDGSVAEGDLFASSDTDTHLEIYRNFEGVGGVVHTHSKNATAWAQACRPIPCLGTTHADTFFGEVPLTGRLTDEQIEKDYELNTGRIIVECFKGKDPMKVPACLIRNHGPFTWGSSPEDAIENSVILEEIAEIAWKTVSINPSIEPIPDNLLQKHFIRKHGGGYGQKKEEDPEEGDDGGEEKNEQQSS